MQKQATTLTSLRTAKISNECADSLENDMLNATEIFAKHDNACLLVVNLLRKCMDKQVKEQWIDAIFGRSSDKQNSNDGPKVT